MDEQTDLTGYTHAGIRLDRHPLISECYRLCLKAEAVEASEAATAASSAAWDLLRSIDKLLDQMPPREHTTSADCWCNPTLDTVTEDGSKVWVHHEPN